MSNEPMDLNEPSSEEPRQLESIVWRRSTNKRLIFLAISLLFLGLFFIIKSLDLAHIFFQRPEFLKELGVRGNFDSHTLDSLIAANSSKANDLELKTKLIAQSDKIYYENRASFFSGFGYIFIIAGIILSIYLYLSSSAAPYITRFNKLEHDESANNSEFAITLQTFDVGRESTIIKDRLINEIARLSKTANLNLAFGSVTTIVAIIFLGYEVFSQVPDFGKDWFKLASHYIPRISILIFAEVFAFFFLRIYKDNLANIKFMHNELTNIEMRLLAAKLAINEEEQPNLKTTIIDFLATERNFILKKNESTIELEKQKIEAADDKNLISSLSEIIKAKIL
jgi:hypothetical protein